LPACGCATRAPPARSWIGGLEKDLLLPYPNQRRPVRVGEQVLVYVYLDETTDRLVATTKWAGFLSEEPFAGRPDDEVQLLIADETDLGYNVIVNGTHRGLLYANEVFRPLRPGDALPGFLRQVRAQDGKLDVNAAPPRLRRSHGRRRYPAGCPARGAGRPPAPRRQKPGRRRVPPSGHEQESV
jgi:hypothetical protein